VLSQSTEIKIQEDIRVCVLTEEALCSIDDYWQAEKSINGNSHLSTRLRRQEISRNHEEIPKNLEGLR
jgi:hypothetical protein